MTPIDDSSIPVHGGDLAAAGQRFGVADGGWLDLSTGINPFSYPIPSLDPDVWHRLPDRAAEKALLEAAAESYGVASVDQIVAMPGSQAIIQLLPRLRTFSSIAIVGPTYAEHAASWTSAGHRVVTCETLDRVGDADVVIVVNPNNPDGHRTDPERLREVAADLHKRRGLLVVDEGFRRLCS